jgi:molybdopterin synthase sulfur carrier subunit
MKTLRVLYFAMLREQRGLSAETLATAAATAAELYAELRARHHFTLPAESLRAALNEEFAPWTAELRDGDVVAFIPPVSGG